MKTRTTFVLMTCLLLTRMVAAQERVTAAPTWQMATAGSVRDLISQWRRLSHETPVEASQNIEALLENESQLVDAPLDSAARAIGLLFPRTRSLTDQFDRPPAEPGQPWQLPPLLDDEQLPITVRQNLALLAGRWLTRHARYDEAIEVMAGLSVDHVVDPAALLFYRGLSLHRLIQTDESVACMEQLLENEDRLPQRFASMSHLMLADMRAFEKGSLDEVSRVMDDIIRRQRLQRSGTRVIGQQEQVIAMLDKLIEDTQQKMQQQQQQQSARQQGSAKPMEQSQNAGGRGTGDISEKNVEEGGSWGNLPPRERAAALIEMTRDLPPHYREVIEEYFRQLARENAGG